MPLDNARALASGLTFCGMDVWRLNKVHGGRVGISFPGSQVAIRRMGKRQRGQHIFPLLTEQLQSARGQRHITVLVAFATPDMQKHALGIDVAHLQAQAFSQAQAAGVNGGETNAMIEGRDLLQHAPHFAGGKDHRQLELGIGADQFNFMWPDAFECFLPEDFHRADGLRAGLPGHFLPRLEMNAILTNLFGGDQVGRFATELAELTHAVPIRLFRAGEDRQQLQIIGKGFQDGVRRTFFICMALL